MGVMGASTPEWAVTTSIGEVSITADAVGVVRMTPWQCWQALMSPGAYTAMCGLRSVDSTVYGCLAG
jgi:hypothetical protein